MERTGVRDFLELARRHPLFDARTPSEFERGHLPGALNLPLFSDDERDEVGTLYKQQGRREAIKRGLDFVGPKMRPLVERVEDECAPPGPVALHCWRGGMRSSSLAWLLELYGFEVVVLEGGYKAYRRHVLETIDIAPEEVVVLGGLTGCGKTEVLGELEKLGEQVIDLEGLAGHRGSAFGGIEHEEATQQQFENELAGLLDELEPEKRIWLEDESRLVGSCCIPERLWETMQAAPLVCLEVPHQTRVKRLVSEYGDHPVGQLEAAFERIEKRLGGRRLRLALEALAGGDLETAAREALAYYDKTYRYGLEQREGQIATTLELSPRPSSAEIAQKLSELRFR